MRLPWIQIAMEVLEVSAPELAARLDISDAEAFYALVRLMAWARARCPDDRPPSASAFVRGPTAFRQVTAAAQLGIDPEAFVEACCTLAFPVLERVDGGVRIRGLDRYDSAWAKNNQEKAATWRASQNDRTETERKPNGNPSVPLRQTQTQTQKKDLPAPKPKRERKPSSAEEFFGWLNATRSKQTQLSDSSPGPRAINALFGKALTEVGRPQLEQRYLAYLNDPEWGNKSPPWPWEGFAKRWRWLQPAAGSAPGPRVVRQGEDLYADTGAA